MYNVAFRNITNGPYNGLITWNQFASEEDFNNYYTEEIKSEKEVVAQEISMGECVSLGSETPLSTWLLISIDKATDPTSKVIDQHRLAMELMKLRTCGFLI